jgi:hypothetical protein
MKKNILYIFLVIILFIITICILLNYYNNKKSKELFQENEKHSFHILLATIGKDSIFDILTSFKQQLEPQDYLTIVFDGPNLPNVDKVHSFVSDFKCKVNVIVEDTNLGYWGHAIRNKHNKLTGDFVFHVDDDDNIPPDCMEILRSTCKDKSVVYIFKINNKGDIIWKTEEIILGQIGTPSGIIPTQINPTSEFVYRYGGDYDFYKTLEKNENKIEYVDKVIYLVRP